IRQQPFPAYLAQLVEDDALHVAGARDAALAHSGHEQIAAPCREPVPGVEQHARSGDRRHPEQLRLPRAFLPRTLLAAVVLAAVGHDGPAVVLARRDDVHLVAAVRSVLELPQLRGIRTDL